MGYPGVPEGAPGEGGACADLAWFPLEAPRRTKGAHRDCLWCPYWGEAVLTWPGCHWGFTRSSARSLEEARVWRVGMASALGKSTSTTCKEGEETGRGSGREGGGQGDNGYKGASALGKNTRTTCRERGQGEGQGERGGCKGVMATRGALALGKSTRTTCRERGQGRGGGTKGAVATRGQ